VGGEQVVVQSGLRWLGSGGDGSSSGGNGSLFQAVRNVDTPHLGSQRQERWNFLHDEIMHRLQHSAIRKVRHKTDSLSFNIDGFRKLATWVRSCKTSSILLHQEMNDAFAKVSSADVWFQEQVPRMFGGQ
jgi:hypothetical protein